MRPDEMGVDAGSVGMVSNVAAACGAAAADVHAELGRIDALLHDAIGRLTCAFGELSATLQGGRELVPGATATEGLHTLARRAEGCLNEAVTALQFQDLVSQHLAYLRRRLTSLDAAMRALAELPPGCRPAFGCGLGSLRTALAELHAGDAAGPVQQEHMSAGNVQLF